MTREQLVATLRALKGKPGVHITIKESNKKR